MNLLTYNLLGIRPKAFGLEIEDSSVKAVYLEKTRSKLRLVSCGRKIMPRGIVQSEQIINSKKLAEEIKILLGSAQPKPIKTKNVIFSIPETHAVDLRTFNFDEFHLSPYAVTGFPSPYSV